MFKVLPEFRNRKVLSVACGEHHTLALVEGDIFNLYAPEDLKAVRILRFFLNLDFFLFRKEKEHLEHQICLVGEKIVADKLQDMRLQII